MRWFYLVLFLSAAICLKDIRYYYFICGLRCSVVSLSPLLINTRSREVSAFAAAGSKGRIRREPENPDVARALRQDKNQNLAYLKDNYDQITALYNLGKFQYVRELFGRHVLSIDTDLNTSAHWGKLAWDIPTGQWDVALEELNTFRETLDAQPLATLHSRAWLVHLSLFVYFNHPAGRTLLLETLLASAYLNTIQSAAPWVLCYLAVSAVLSPRAQASGGTAPPSLRVRPAIREVELYVEFYFEAAQHQLQLAERVVGNDFFLSEFREEFLDNARYLIGETYCRIHQRIDIADLTARLNLSLGEGEKWIVDLIRDTRLAADAKIDLEKERPLPSPPPPS
ncbi:hypothetical protein EDB83DRAFT_2531472 [Lactarius deliciosus]|nr:hypothetical protein EDB83DRAFT_2531472 [Lactarius deliciosus]